MKKKFILVAVAAIALTAAPLAFAGAASNQHAAVKLSGGQSVTVTCSGKSLTAAKSSKTMKLTCVPNTPKPRATTAPAPKPTVTTPPATVPPAPALTEQQKQAVAAAKQYLSLGEGFSQQGLIDQLDSSAGDGYSVNDATVAVDSLNVNWNAQAVIAAKAYLQTQPFSCTDLIQQLDSSAGDHFTVAQATYGATQAGAC